MGCSGYLYTFVLLLCVGCAYSTCEYGGTENASLLLELPRVKSPRGKSTSPRGFKNKKKKSNHGLTCLSSLMMAMINASTLYMGV